MHLEISTAGGKLWRYRYEFHGKERIFALASLALSMLGRGLWMLFTHFWEVLAFAKRLISGGP
ncbi:hypothetical protein GCM10007874_11160 [Labrys miyagiensis]|uniref:Uncharacterized protein n=1 Tax=Labrys miyagiensis TaxID=346912 RepID=A0ABQ6CGW8_9HYPH|nr:Arm DNA-binding domain-containing protein [Labrys miyagiensis]GLS18100.1 hypothetical protein GCM10007874_11160 [Labrys miyagiensis]